MKTLNLAKNLGLTALSCVALAAGTAQAANWGGHNPYLPVSVQVAPQHHDHRGFDDRFQHAYTPRHDNLGNIDQRQQRQIERIRHGIASGQINRHEARDLLREQREIERTQRRYQADGQLSRGEWIRLNHMLDRASVAIREEKHDRNWR